MEEKKEEKALAKAPREPLAFVPKNLDDAWRVSELLAKAQVIPDALRGKPNDLLVIVMTGTELGLSPMQAVRNISVVKGKPYLESLLRVALVKQSPECEYFRLVESTSDHATFETRRRGEGVTRLSYTLKEAQDAGLYPGPEGGNWRKDPTLMLRRRCEGRLADEVYPDVVRGVGDTSALTERELNPQARRPATQAPPLPEPEDAEVVPPTPPSPPKANGKKLSDMLKEDAPVAGEVKRATDTITNSDMDRAGPPPVDEPKASPPPPNGTGDIDVPGLLMRLADARTAADIDALAPVAQQVQGPMRSKVRDAFKARRAEVAKFTGVVP